MAAEDLPQAPGGVYQLPGDSQSSPSLLPLHEGGWAVPVFIPQLLLAQAPVPPLDL